MDEALVHFEPRRQRAVLRALESLHPDVQAACFTCHGEFVRRVGEEVEGLRRVALEARPPQAGRAPGDPGAGMGPGGPRGGPAGARPDPGPPSRKRFGESLPFFP